MADDKDPTNLSSRDAAIRDADLQARIEGLPRGGSGLTGMDPREAAYIQQASNLLGGGSGKVIKKAIEEAAPLLRRGIGALMEPTSQETLPVAPESLPTVRSPEVPKLRLDNPGGEWLAEKLRYAQETRQEYRDKGRLDSIYATVGGTEGVTGYFGKSLHLDPKALVGIKGTMREELSIPGEKLRRLKESISEEGYSPNSILMVVREDGVPFVTEGNNRLAEAIESGRPSIEVELKYLRGAEGVDGRISPDKLSSMIVEGLTATPASENVGDVVSGYAVHGRVVGNQDVSIDSLYGGVSTAVGEQAQVNELVDQIRQSGEISRLIIDQDNNVIEGAHRLEALRKMGVDSVPVVRIEDMASGMPVAEIREALKEAGLRLHSDQVNQLISNVLEATKEAGSAREAKAQFEPPAGFEKAWTTALDIIAGGDKDFAAGGFVDKPLYDNARIVGL